MKLESGTKLLNKNMRKFATFVTRWDSHAQVIIQVQHTLQENDTLSANNRG